MVSEQAGTPATPTRRRKPWLAIVLFILAALMLSAALAVVWMLTTESGTRALLSLLGRQVPMQVSGVRGTIADELQIEELQLAAGENRIRLEGLRMRWQPWQLQDGLLAIDRLAVRSVTLLTQPGKDEPPQVPASLELPFRLSLRDMQVGRLVVKQGEQQLLSAADVSLSLHYDGQQHRLQLHQLDVLPEGAAAISGRLSGELAIAATRPFALDGKFQLSGKHAEGSARGLLQLGGTLPALSTRFSLQLARAGREAALAGTAALRPFAVQPFAGADLQARGLDLAMLSRDLPETRIDAELRMRSPDSGSFSFANAIAGPLSRSRLPVVQASGDFRLAEDAVQLNSLSVNDGEFNGAVGLQRTPEGATLHAEGTLRKLRVTDYWRPPAGLPEIILSGRFDLDGRVADKPSGSLAFELENSRIGKWPVSGSGILALDPVAVAIEQLALRVGVNRLEVDGRLDMAGGDLNFSLDAPKLAQLGQAFAGSARLDGRLSGNVAAPTVTARWQAESLRLPGGLAVAGTSGSIQAGSTLKAPLQLDANGKRIRVGDTRLDSLQVVADGSLASHELQLQLSQQQDSVRLRASGGINALDANARWRGRIEQLETRGRLTLSSETPAPLTIDHQSFALSNLRLSSEFGRIVIDQLARSPEQLTSSGGIEALPVAALLRQVRQDAVAGSDLMLAGRWDITLPQQAGARPSGSVQLQRSSGDLVMSGAQQIALGLSTLSLEARAVGERIAVTLDARGKQLGTIAFGGSVLTGSGALPVSTEAPIDGVLRLELPSIAAAAALASPTVIANGSVNGRIFITGTLADPKLSGQLAGRDLRVLLADSGFVLSDGKLDARLSGDKLTLNELSFAGSKGTGRLVLSGPVRFDEGHAAGKLDWRLERFLAFDRVDRQLQVSGKGQLALSDSRVDVSGNVVVDRGFFDVGRADAPELSDDVVIVGEPEAPPRALALGLDLTVALGNQIRLQGRGLDARIGGTLQLLSAPGEPLSAKGEVTVTKGTYTAYGRELAIERGVLRFDGPPSNPALDIRAMRRGTEVAAGVSIVGTAQAPRISLVSEPQVPDAEKLSWLVLGQGLSATSGAQVGMLQDAAAGLLAQGAAAGLQSQVASALGVDTISLSRSRDNLQQRIVTVGKRLSSRLYLSYQHGLQTASSIVLLRYTLSPRVTLEAETGARSVFSVFYNFSFD